MQKNYCDLCGKEIKADSYSVKIARYEKKPDSYLGITHDVWMNYTYELCQECNEDIYQYIETKKLLG